MSSLFLQHAAKQNAVTSCTYKLSGDAWQAVQDLEDFKRKETKDYSQNDEVSLGQPREYKIMLEAFVVRREKSSKIEAWYCFSH